MRVAIITAIIAPLITLALLFILNDTSAAQTVTAQATTSQAASFAGAPWILGAGLLALLSFARVRQQ